MSISTSISDIPDASSLERKANKVKFELELEMMLSLANPHYLLELSSTGYLDSEPFMNFVEYLAYWEKPEFARFIIYPNALHHRRLLLKPLFRQALKTQGHALVQKLADAQYEHWVSWRADKSKPPFEDGPTTATTST
ncbi:Transcriptional regulator SOH1 [Phaffia rhodozyma]|uniref:Mediator of RNA polymerase II transcription subunit 31 n=1 Tax=Phaffia rhodozyma TaxID=264483 RepID=A0A0F7SFE2_PHARH|nr:Transcriptional regulator SOH1 [Phaffia rhodozyma]